jgi:transportin-3
MIWTTGITPALQNQCFLCLGAWLRAGQAPAISIKGTAILSSAFAALTNDELFDDAVSFLVDVIHETQELDDNVELIQEIMPQLIALRPQLLDPETREDEDKMRGLCRILVEAGEWYERLILRHQASFLPLVELIALCAEYDNLEVVRITLNFWYRLSRGLREVREDPANQPLLDIYSRLVATIIRHLHYPDDADSLQGQERDDFRNFRHTIGDTLKDCCSVLGAVACLTRSYEIISSTLALAGTGTVKWQDLEAPLFSMRSMGAEVDPADNEIMPRILELLPSLPSHPKIRYAAILVIGRYTRWIDYHPEHIQFQLPYVSSGFQDSDVEVSAASAQTMKYLCKDCSHHLVPFLPQLHNFIQTVESKLGAQDLLDLAAAIAHIIAVMPPVDAPQALSTFCMPIVEIVHSVANKSTPATKDELRSACDALERLSTYLSIVDHFEGGLPRECEGTCVQIWTVLDVFLAKYGGDAKVAEKTCVAIRRGLTFFGDAAFRVAPAILDRLAGSFVGSPASSYLWITAKMIGLFAGRRDAVFGEMMQSAVDRESAHVHALLQRSPPSLLSDGESHLLFLSHACTDDAL